MCFKFIKQSCKLKYMHSVIRENVTVSALQTFGESQFLGDGACDFGRSCIAVEVHFIHAVPIHVGPTQLQTVDGCGVAVRGERVNQ